MTTRTETINIVIREDGSRVVKRNLENIGGAAGVADKGIGFLKKAIGGLVAGAVVNQLRQLADSFTTIQNRLRLTTTDQANLNAVFNELQAISTRTRSSLEANVDLYSRLSLAAKSLGVSQQEVLQFTESVNKAIKISGATAAEAEGGLRQLSQGLASGALRGDELNSVMENLPAVADVVAKSLGITRGELRKMGQEGKITGDIILKAFREAREELDEKFKTTVPTVAEGFVLLKNQLLETVGAMDQASGSSSIIGGVLLSLVNLLREFTPELVNMTRALVGTLDPADEMSSGMKVLTTVLVTLYGILKALGTLIFGTVIYAFKAVGGVIGGVAAAVVAAVKGNFTEAYDIVKQLGTDQKDLYIEANNEMAEGAIAATTDMFEKLDQIWDKGARQIQDRSKQAVGSVSTVAGPAAPKVIDEAAAEKARKAMERLQNQLRGVLNDIAPLEGATMEMAKAQEILAQATAKKLITAEDEQRYLQLLEKAYVDILDPLGRYTRELDEQTMLLGMSAREREVEAQVIEASKALLEDGVMLTEREVAMLREKFTALQDLNEVTQAQDQLLSNSVEVRRSFITQLIALQNLLADPSSGFTGGDAGAAVSGLVSSMGLDPTTLQANQAAVLQQFATMYEQIDMLRQADLISEQEAAGLRAQVWAQSQAAQLQTAEGFFGQLAQLQKSENSKIAAIGKAAAITQAIINTYQAATAAYASLAGIPYVGPALGAAAAAAAVVAGMANVAQIRNQPTGFMTGGSFTVGGNGGADSQMVSFRATPGERVSVATPQQVRKGDPTEGGQPQQAPQVNQRIINVVDPAMVGDFLATPEGESVFINVMRRNSDQLRAIAGQG